MYRVYVSKMTEVHVVSLNGAGHTLLLQYCLCVDLRKSSG